MKLKSLKLHGMAQAVADLAAQRILSDLIYEAGGRRFEYVRARQIHQSW